jgi:quercetin dioxygenase-like cupin family protein
MTNDRPPSIRRVVTGHDAHGVAKVIIDGPAGNVKSIGPGGSSTLMWSTDAMPADIAIGESVEDRGARILGTAPPPRGTRFAVNVFPPATRGHMHRTETIDYAIVLEGEIDMLLDDTEVHLKAGDFLIQQGTNHAWVNRGAVPCKIAFVLIDAAGAPIVPGD